MRRTIVSLQTKMHIVLTAQDILSQLCLLHVRALTLLQCRAIKRWWFLKNCMKFPYILHYFIQCRDPLPFYRFPILSIIAGNTLILCFSAFQNPYCSLLISRCCNFSDEVISWLKLLNVYNKHIKREVNT